jgi:hypothetical protein
MPSGIQTPLITFRTLGYVKLSLGYLRDILFSKDIPGIFITYPIFVNFKLRNSCVRFVASETNVIDLG